MTFAHITADTITALGNPPGLEWDGTRWWDLRDPTIRTARGWLEVTETPRPEPVEGGFHEYTVELVDGLPVRIWTYRAWTADELASRAEQNARFDSIEDRLARIEAHLWPAPPDPTATTGVPTMADHGGVWPNQGLLLDGGKVWRNVSGTPLTTAPSGFPGTPSQWAHLFVVALTPPVTPPAGILPWSATTEYKAGDKATRNGHLWQCLVAHGAAYAGTWGPPTVGVWKDIGPA